MSIKDFLKNILKALPSKNNLENMSISSLKLLHEEKKLFLQITWSSIISLVVALLAGTIVLVGIVIILAMTIILNR